MALIFPDVVRFTIVGSVNGEDCMNILDVHAAGPVDPTYTREDVIFELAGDILNQWSDHILPGLNQSYVAEEVRWVDLDNADGSTGSRSATDGSTWPEAGANSGAAMPNNVYIKVVKQVEGKGRRERNGILRLGGVSEAATIAGAGNTLDPQTITYFQDAFENLKDGINGVSGYGTWNLVVLHTVNRQATGTSEIANFVPAPTVGTIRRRMPGYGT